MSGRFLYHYLHITEKKTFCLPIFFHKLFYIDKTNDFGNRKAQTVSLTFLLFEFAKFKTKFTSKTTTLVN